METVKLRWDQTRWGVLCLLWLLSSTSAHSEDIHDVSDNQEVCHEKSTSCSTPAQQEPDHYEALWVENLDLAQKTLELPFLQRMQTGDLQADDYTSFLLQDVFYLAKVTEMLAEMAERVEKPEELNAFMEGMFNKYERSRVQMLQNLNLNGVTEIKVTKAMEAYLEEYRRVMEEEEPIMFAVSLLPCSRLWVWLTNNLNIESRNAYWTWKKRHMDGRPEKHFKHLLNTYLHEENFEKANEIFRNQMQNEYNFFKASEKI